EIAVGIAADRRAVKTLGELRKLGQVVHESEAPEQFMPADRLVDALAELHRRHRGPARCYPIVQTDLRRNAQVRLGVLIDDGQTRRVLLGAGDLVSGILLAGDGGPAY